MISLSPSLLGLCVCVVSVVSDHFTGEAKHLKLKSKTYECHNIIFVNIYYIRMGFRLFLLLLKNGQNADTMFHLTVTIMVLVVVVEPTPTTIMVEGSDIRC